MSSSCGSIMAVRVALITLVGLGTASAADAAAADAKPHQITSPGAAARSAATAPVTEEAAKRHDLPPAAEGAGGDARAPVVWKKGETTLRFGRFGQVTIYRPTSTPTHAALFLSGDGGWNSGVVDMAKMLVAKEYLVIGIDLPRFLGSYSKSQERCAYPPGDLQALSQFVQKKLGVKRYLVPQIVGYSSGATLAYAALVQAPPGTFEGAVSLGFCSDLAIRRPMCKGDGLTTRPLPKGHGLDLLPAPELKTPWIALHGKVDQVCNLKKTAAFIKATGSARMIELDRVGHGFGVQRRWQTQMEQAVRDISAAAFHARARAFAIKQKSASKVAAADTVSNDQGDLELPLIEVRPKLGVKESDLLAVLVTGDGGWAGLDQEVASGLSESGIPVIGFDALQYFWLTKTPEIAAADLAQLLGVYLQGWQKKRIIAIGYSFGADVLPFMLSRQSEDLRRALAATVFISPSPKAAFEFKVTDWFGGEGGEAPTLAVEPEIQKLKGQKILCFYGRSDKTSLCPRLTSLATVKSLPGGHRLGDVHEELVEGIVDAVGIAPETAGDD